MIRTSFSFSASEASIFARASRSVPRRLSLSTAACSGDAMELIMQASPLTHAIRESGRGWDRREVPRMLRKKLSESHGGRRVSTLGVSSTNHLSRSLLCLLRSFRWVPRLWVGVRDS